LLVFLAGAIFALAIFTALLFSSFTVLFLVDHYFIIYDIFQSIYEDYS